MALTHSKPQAYATTRLTNAARRPREYLTADEVERLMAAVRSGRHGHRDATLILIAYRHGLRVSELVGLRWDMFDFPQGHLHVRRLKNGRPSIHLIRGSELRALRRLKGSSQNSRSKLSAKRRA